MANAALRLDAGDARALNQSIADAEPGAVIQIAAGDYHLPEPLILAKPVTLVGAGMDQTRILCGASGVVVRFDVAGPYAARNLTFAHDGDEPAAVAVVTAGPFDCRSCRFTGAVGK